MHVTSAWVVDEEEEVEEDEDDEVDGEEEEDVGEEDEDDEVDQVDGKRRQSAAVTAPSKRRRLNADDGP